MYLSSFQKLQKHPLKLPLLPLMSLTWEKRYQALCTFTIHQQLLSSAMDQYCGLLPVDRVVVLPCMLCYSWPLHHSLSQASRCSFSLVSSLRLVYPWGIRIPRGTVSFTLVKIEQRVHPDLKTTDIELSANTPDVFTHSSYTLYHHQWSLLLLSLVWAACVCCSLCGQGRSIADKVHRVTVLLDDSRWSTSSGGCPACWWFLWSCMSWRHLTTPLFALLSLSPCWQLEHSVETLSSYELKLITDNLFFM